MKIRNNHGRLLDRTYESRHSGSDSDSLVCYDYINTAAMYINFNRDRERDGSYLPLEVIGAD
jgi:hypothetical protein